MLTSPLTEEEYGWTALAGLHSTWIHSHGAKPLFRDLPAGSCACIASRTSRSSRLDANDDAPAAIPPRGSGGQLEGGPPLRTIETA